jgi:ethanolaminephosphotransferase
MVFDHGCDAINAAVGGINLVMQLGIPLDHKYALLAALATPYVPFFFATWEEYYLGKLILPVINGPSEGVLLGVFICECACGVAA